MKKTLLTIALACVTVLTASAFPTVLNTSQFEDSGRLSVKQFSPFTNVFHTGNFTFTNNGAQPGFQFQPNADQMRFAYPGIAVIARMFTNGNMSTLGNMTNAGTVTAAAATLSTHLATKGQMDALGDLKQATNATLTKIATLGTGSNGVLTNSGGVLSWVAVGGGGGSQTPWTSDIDGGAVNSLKNVFQIIANDLMATNAVTVGDFDHGIMNDAGLLAFMAGGGARYWYLDNSGNLYPNLAYPTISIGKSDNYVKTIYGETIQARGIELKDTGSEAVNFNVNNDGSFWSTNGGDIRNLIVRQNTILEGDISDITLTVKGCTDNTSNPFEVKTSTSIPLFNLTPLGEARMRSISPMTVATAANTTQIDIGSGGYTVGDLLTLGTLEGVSATIQVDSVIGGGDFIDGWTIVDGGLFFGTQTVTASGGTGSGAQFTVSANLPINGRISAQEPTISSNVATKAYVDGRIGDISVVTLIEDTTLTTNYHYITVDTGPNGSPIVITLPADAQPSFALEFMYYDSDNADWGVTINTVTGVIVKSNSATGGIVLGAHSGGYVSCKLVFDGTDWRAFFVTPFD